MNEYVILQDLAVIFAVSLLVILLFHRLKLPALPGFIVAGVLVGPDALGLVSDVHQVESLAEVGVILLLFTIGIEFSLGRLREMSREVVVGGLTQVGLTVGATALAARAFAVPWTVSPCCSASWWPCRALRSSSRDSPTRGRSTRRTAGLRPAC